MKTFFTVILMLCLFNMETKPQNVIFLHHSTGEALFNEGLVSDYFSNYNSQHHTSYQITERAYPDSPYPWENYPYDYWNLWANGQCDNGNDNIKCLSSICGNYDVVVFKHCFPGADILADDQHPEISSANKTLANYKLQYRALRELMDAHPDNKFIVWTLVPLHRLATSAGNAGRAREFVNWVKDEWLDEDGEDHPNIFIFDFFNLAAESNISPDHGQVNCLRYAYEKSHSNSDSHPNQLANQTIGPQFAGFVIHTIENQNITSTPDVSRPPSHYLSYDRNNLTISTKESKLFTTVYIYSVSGRLICTKLMDDNICILDISKFPKGGYIIALKGENEVAHEKMLLQ